MAKENFAVKLDSDLNAQLKQLQGEYNSGQEFGEALLLALKEQRLNTNTDSQVKAEQLRVRKALADVERLVAATLEIAASDKLKAEESAHATVEAAQAENRKLKEINQSQQAQISVLTDKTQEQAKQIKNLEQTAESVVSLKEAWAAKEQALTARLAELDSEAREAQQLKAQLSELKQQFNKQERVNLQLQHKNEIIVKDAQMTAESVSSLKKLWEEKEQTLTQSLTKRIAELDNKAQEAKELRIQISELKTQLNEQEKATTQFQHQAEITTKNVEIKVHKKFQTEKDSLIEKHENQIQALNKEIQRLLAGEG